mmetsp:Transcript_1549/g.3726  ORF Transcript_1549/g.3726 Transcript_1549/m.3726 type:complete len:208 (+) Transcript_1549:454-1077(+)
MRRETLRHQPGTCRRPRVPRRTQRTSRRLQPHGRRQRRRVAHGNLKQKPKGGRLRHLATSALQAALCAQRMYGVGTGLHPRRARELQQQRQPRGGVHRRARRAEAQSRQLCNRTQRRQGAHEATRPHHKSGHAGEPVQENGAAARHSAKHGAGNAVRRAAQHRAHRSEEARNSTARSQGVLLQVQRSHICQDGKTRNHYRTGERPKR